MGCTKMELVAMKKKYHYTDYQQSQIKALYPTTLTREISDLLSIPVNKIYQYAKENGLKKDKDFVVLTNRNLIKAMEDKSKVNRFYPGQTSWNKGKKIGCLSPATTFKKGNLPANTLHDGAITVRKDNRNIPYKWIRISKAKWEPLHIHLYRTAIGEIPKGGVVAFKDGDTMNTDISNLELITMQENMLRNSIQRYPEEVKTVMRLIGKLKKTINTEQHG